MWRWCGLCLLLVALSVPAETLTGRVVGVHDGDTLTLLVERQPVKVRLVWIDAPELAQWSGPCATHRPGALVSPPRGLISPHRRGSRSDESFKPARC
jgi:hypothetical protein